MTDDIRKDFEPRVLMLDTGHVLIGDVMTNNEGKGNVFGYIMKPCVVYIMKPCVVWADEQGNPHMEPWIPMAADEVHPYPIDKVMTILHPTVVYLRAYREFQAELVRRLKAAQKQMDEANEAAKKRLN